MGTGPAGVGVLQTSGKIGLIPPLPLCAMPRVLANVFPGTLYSESLDQARTSSSAQARCSRSEDAKTSAGPDRFPALRVWAASAISRAADAAPVSPKQSAGCSIANPGAKNSPQRRPATPHSLAPKLSPLNPANTVRLGPGLRGSAAISSAIARLNPSPRAG